jgi:hypothetical protein
MSLYALTATMGVAVFLLFVDLMYLAAPSPSTTKVWLNGTPKLGSIRELTNRHMEIHQDNIKLWGRKNLRWSSKCRNGKTY